ncbi:hypothetical protein ILYODFUR_014291 [Ilyodon furcidens]|uniref:Uncharacterized protein n=1 Tax=Ilyodon furcidens TaxID=33524 RepID=A0ABV0TIK0_9TELE
MPFRPGKTAPLGFVETASLLGTSLGHPWIQFEEFMSVCQQRDISALCLPYPGPAEDQWKRKDHWKVGILKPLPSGSHCHLESFASKYQMARIRAISWCTAPLQLTVLAEKVYTSDQDASWTTPFGSLLNTSR